MDAWRSAVICPPPPGPMPTFTFVEFELVDMNGEPCPGEPCRVTLADGTLVETLLDDKGKLRIEGVVKGDCKITFPELDSEAWEAADA
jgi:hypothetical protein